MRIAENVDVQVEAQRLVTIAELFADGTIADTDVDVCIEALLPDLTARVGLFVNGPTHDRAVANLHDTMDRFKQGELCGMDGQRRFVKVLGRYLDELRELGR